MTFDDSRELGWKQAGFEIVKDLSALIHLKMPSSPPLARENYMVPSENKMEELMKKMLCKIMIFLFLKPTISLTAHFLEPAHVKLSLLFQLINLS